MALAIIRSVIDFKRDPWPKVSDNAKDLVKKMLNPDPKQRLTAQEVLGTLLYIYYMCFIYVDMYCIYIKNHLNYRMQNIRGYKMPRKLPMFLWVRL